ncbi:MAG: TRAP transporter substrate-binding protein DctP [Myxococcales bacterium]|nr:TRAP transporter substrate-binding protein DctP [Myxococcales bacterium]
MANKKWTLSAMAAVAAMVGVGASLSVEAQTAPAAATPQVTISIATLAPAGSTWMNVFDAWNRELRRESAKINQPMRLQFFAGGVQGDEAEVIRKIRAGRLDGAAVTAVGLYQIYRPALVFQMPGMFRDYGRLDRARTQLNTEISQQMSTAGFELMGWADVGQARVFSQSPVASPANLASQRPWVWSDDRAMPTFYSVINANPVRLGVPEVLSALQTNRINAVVTSPAVAVQLQWATRMTHMTDMSLYTTIGATVLGRNKFNSLTPQQQELLRRTGLNYHQLARGSLRRAEQAALNSLRERGVTAVAVDAAGVRAWETAFATTRQRLTGQIADAPFIERVAAIR